MTKKTLEEKIKQVGFWTSSGVFSYLVIAFFLKSNYPIYEYSFNREDAYDAIKDALTLAAAFLAPVAAFVLFSDWREEHRVKLLYSSIDEIKKLVRETGDTLRRIKMNIYQRDLKQKELISMEENNILQKQLTALSRLYADIDVKDTDLKKLTSLINSFGSKVYEAKNKLGILEYSSVKTNQLRAEDEGLGEEKNREEINFYLHLFSENLSKYDEYYKEVEAISDQIILIGIKIKNKI